MPLSRRALLRQSLTFAPLVPGALASPIFANSPTETSSNQWYWYPGHALCFKAIAKDTGGTCTWMLVENAPREGVPFHKHLYEDESFYVIDGLFEMTAGDTTVSGGPGTYVYGPRNVPHRWTTMGSSRGRLLNVFSPSGIEQSFLSVAIAVTPSSQQPTVDMVSAPAPGSGPSIGATLLQGPVWRIAFLTTAISRSLALFRSMAK